VVGLLAGHRVVFGFFFFYSGFCVVGENGRAGSFALAAFLCGVQDPSARPFFPSLSSQGVLILSSPKPEKI